MFTLLQIIGPLAIVSIAVAIWLVMRKRKKQTAIDRLVERKYSPSPPGVQTSTKPTNSRIRGNRSGAFEMDEGFGEDLVGAAMAVGVASSLDIPEIPDFDDEPLFPNDNNPTHAANKVADVEIESNDDFRRPASINTPPTPQTPDPEPYRAPDPEPSRSSSSSWGSSSDSDSGSDD